MPVYQLLGGKCRFAVDTYTSVGAATPRRDSRSCPERDGSRPASCQNTEWRIRRSWNNWYINPISRMAGFGMPNDSYMDDQAYLREVPKMFEGVRKRCGEEIELLHDIHERCQPMDVINMCRKLEEYQSFLY